MDILLADLFTALGSTYRSTNGSVVFESTVLSKIKPTKTSVRYVKFNELVQREPVRRPCTV
jgi:hypothetical protein